MRLSIKACTISLALLWAGSVLLVGLLNLIFPCYGFTFLQMISSVYPGFHNSRTIASVLIGTGYALVDGGLGGLFFAWLYNAFSGDMKGP
ncbi:MAG TPA: hypothetical protein VMX16_04450 [Terriglobia bacterium]|nr:hypothetical protein [Terriglobia bacterium]